MLVTASTVPVFRQELLDERSDMCRYFVMVEHPGVVLPKFNLKTEGSSHLTENDVSLSVLVR